MLHCFRIKVPARKSEVNLILFLCVGGLTTSPRGLYEFFLLFFSPVFLVLILFYCFCRWNELIMSETFFCVFDLAFYMFILCLFISNTFLYSGTILFFPLFLSLTFPAPFQHCSVILLFHTLLNLKSVKNIVPKYFFSF